MDNRISYTIYQYLALLSSAKLIAFRRKLLLPRQSIITRRLRCICNLERLAIERLLSHDFFSNRTYLLVILLVAINLFIPWVPIGILKALLSSYGLPLRKFVVFGAAATNFLSIILQSDNSITRLPLRV
jgi:hypothetical protein